MSGPRVLPSPTRRRGRRPAGRPTSVGRTARLLLAGLAVVLAGCTTDPPTIPEADEGIEPPPAAGRGPSRGPRPVPSTSLPVVPSGSGSGWWRPGPGLSWQWQLSGGVDVSVVADVFDVDLFETSAATVGALQARGSRVICYFSAGSFEEWRPDASRFPVSVLGAALEGWPGERWLDVRRLEVLEPVMAARMDLCRAKGFDGVEADNVDGYANRSGFALGAGDQLAFNRMLARLAHERGLAIGLKNDLEQVAELVGVFDFAVNEECAAWGECALLAPFVAAGKAVFHAEYAVPLSGFCARSRELGLSSIRKRLDLDAWRQSC